MTAIQSSPSATKKMGGRAEACRPKETDMLTVAQKELGAKPHAQAKMQFGQAKVKSKEESIAEIIGNGGFKKLSASQAGLLYRECHYDKQVRDLSKAGQQHMLVLADIMKRGEWRERDAIQFAKIGEKFVIVNGHHRLSAQEQSGIAIEWTVIVYDCETITDVAELYTKFDTNARVRTNQQVLNALDLGEELGLSRTLVERLFSAAPLIASNLDTARNTRDPLVQNVIDRRVEWLQHLAPQARIFEECVQNAEKGLKKRLFAQGPIAVAMLTIKHQQQKAREFWKGIADNDGLRRGDPRHTYIAAVSNTRRNQSGSAWMSAAMAAVTWNAYFADRRLTYIRPTPGVPIRVLGTPLAKG